jgi:hypothetical protein
MYVQSTHLKSDPEQEIVCLFTGESYVHLEGGDTTLIQKEILEGALEELPPRFYRMPFIIRNNQGQIRVFGSIE